MARDKRHRVWQGTPSGFYYMAHQSSNEGNFSDLNFCCALSGEETHNRNKCNGVTVNTGIAVAPRFTDLPGSSPASIGPSVFERPFLGLLIGMAL